MISTVLPPLATRLFSRAKFPDTEFVYLNGPTCVGKGYLLRLFEEYLDVWVSLGFIRVGMISFGDIIKDLLESNNDFKKAYGDVVKRGDLIPDHEAILIFETEVDKMARKGMPNLVFVDGFCRSPDQIVFAARNGYLVEGDKVFMIEASESICLARFMHRCENKPDGRKRIDAEMPTFHKRYRLHQEVVPKQIGLFRECDCSMLEIDGNPSIVESVFPTIRKSLRDVFIKATKGERYEPAVVVR